MKQLTIGLVAHVDSGKTTLSESMLYLSGSLRKQGRVDHGDAFLDNDHLEKERGITIFSKIARCSYKDTFFTLLDTPGHVDFSAEMERTLHVLDCAVLVINGSEGVQSHTETLWKLLSHYHVPVFLFVNKMDLSNIKKEDLLAQLRHQCSPDIEDFQLLKDAPLSADYGLGDLTEALAMHREDAMETFLSQGCLPDDLVCDMVKNRELFPCFWGSALKNDGVLSLLDGLARFTSPPSYSENFGASVFKIAKDAVGKRLTYLKITGGTLVAKQLLTGRQRDGECWEEKVDEIRLYSGEKYEQAGSVTSGSICAVTGLSKTYAGEGLGYEKDCDFPLLEPIINYQILLPDRIPAATAFAQLKQLCEEAPELQLSWERRTQEIHIKLMGPIQTEIFSSLVKERFGYLIEFGPGQVLYKETIDETIEGVGHFEPLRHYAEVHLLLEPGEVGSGLVFDSRCREEVLAKNWQHLILTHLAEREHPGVLMGAPITDMKITLVSGRAHLKHTEGGDFRQATYRALRQGLKKATCHLLEPYYAYRLTVPTETLGKVMTDLQQSFCSVNAPQSEGEFSILEGIGPALLLNDYVTKLQTITSGRGSLTLSFDGYQACHNEDEVLGASHYDSETDQENPTGSVFCAHGAGFVVPWNEVENYMHLESVFLKSDGQMDGDWDGYTPTMAPASARSHVYQGTLAEDKELDAIFERTFGPTKRRIQNDYYENMPKVSAPPTGKTTEDYLSKRPVAEKKRYLLVDGYNIIFSWESLHALARESLDAARGRLMDILSNYRGYTDEELILVFDAYKVKGNLGSVSSYHNIHVVYTKEAETADMYIEKTTHEIGKKYHVTVATSDGLEQMIVLGEGAYRISAREFYNQVISVTGKGDF